MTDERPPAGSQNQVPAILLVIGMLLVAASSFARLWDGDAAAAHHGLSDLARAVWPAAIIFLFGVTFLITPPSLAKAPPETLRLLHRPHVRRRIAFGFFAVGAALILFSFYRAI
jgi:hypothetical protein